MYNLSTQLKFTYLVLFAKFATQQCIFGIVIKKLFELGPFFGQDSIDQRLQRHYEETVYFGQLSPQDIMVSSPTSNIQFSPISISPHLQSSWLHEVRPSISIDTLIFDQKSNSPVSTYIDILFCYFCKKIQLNHILVRGNMITFKGQVKVRTTICFHSQLQKTLTRKHLPVQSRSRNRKRCEISPKLTIKTPERLH